ncbi:MAG: phosphatidate cytidylyltransferase [Candidatus Cloacimonadia bacterium]
MDALKRILIAIIFIPLIIVVCYLGNYYLLGFLTIVSMLGLYELRKMFQIKEVALPFIIIPLGGLSLWLMSLLDGIGIAYSLLLLFIIFAGYDVFTNRIDGAFNRLSHGLFAIFYQPYLYSLIYKTRLVDNGHLILVSIIIMIWATDTFAYFLGMLIGKHRGVFQVSPKKSIEGFVAGLIFAFIAAFIIHYFYKDILPLNILLLGAVSAGVFGQLGDLIESLFKRDVGVKDSSKIIPGHGGMLDRFDSLVLTVPVFYLLYHLFI